MKILSLKERKALVAELPWVTLLKKPQERCDGIKYGKVALRDIFEMNGKPPRGIQERARCKRQGWYRFKSLKKSWGTDGVYCYSHLSQQFHDNDEHKRVDRWMRKNHPELYN